jgi:hypothetical protein
MKFLVNIQENFLQIPIYSVNTRNMYHFHTPIAKLSCLQKSAYYSSIKILSLIMFIYNKESCILWLYTKLMCVKPTYLC